MNGREASGGGRLGLGRLGGLGRIGIRIGVRSLRGIRQPFRVVCEPIIVPDVLGMRGDPFERIPWNDPVPRGAVMFHAAPAAASRSLAA